jgi:DNA polymerase III epsilon subunit-like protein
VAVVASSSDVAAKNKAILGPFDSAELTPAEQRYVAVDCEMVGVGAEGARSALAQVVIVDYAGRVMYQKYVKCAERVTDYRTAVSGIRPEHLSNPAFGAVDFATAQREVAELVRGKVIVGHALHNDMKALMMGHSWREVRDTAKYRAFTFRNKAGQLRPRRLKHLALQHLGCVIQEGEHEPAEDARAALALYRKYRREWETGQASGGAAAAGGASGGAGGAGARGRSKSGGPDQKRRAAVGAGSGARGEAASAGAELGAGRERSASAPRKLKGGGGWQEIKRARGAKAELKAANIAAGIFPGRPGHGAAAAAAAGGAEGSVDGEAAPGAAGGRKGGKGGKPQRGRSRDSRKPRREEGGIPDFD